MSFQFTFDEVLHDAREFAPSKTNPPFRLVVREKDGGVSIMVEDPDAEEGKGVRVHVVLNPDDALRMAKALQGAAALVRR